MSNAIQKKLGGRIVEFRRAAGLTQEQLAEKVGVTPVTISRLERGVTVPSLATLSKIGEALNAGMPDLFDFQRGRTTKEREIESLALKLKQRTPGEVSLIGRLAAAVFQHHDSRSGT
jgi:transcriptional regulator with XRE-family HTH domain